MQTLRLRRGITYIEVMVSLSILIMLGASIAPLSYAWYRSMVSRSARDALQIALRHARAESQSDQCEGTDCSAGAAHGVAVQSGRFTVFQGTSYSSRDARFDEDIGSDAPREIAGASEAVFASQTADVSAPADFVLTDQEGRISTTSVGSLGQISQTY